MNEEPPEPSLTDYLSSWFGDVGRAIRSVFSQKKEPDLSVFPVGRSYLVRGYQPIVTEPHGPPPQSISAIIPFPALQEVHEALLIMANAGKASLMEEPPNDLLHAEMLYADPEWLPPEN